jgi:hypothetical protein
MYASAFGPWASVHLSERIARLRALRALVQVLAHNHIELRAALVAAESGNTDMLAAALVLFERMPASSRRKIVASYCELDRNTKAVKQTSQMWRTIMASVGPERSALRGVDERR